MSFLSDLAELFITPIAQWATDKFQDSRTGRILLIAASLIAITVAVALLTR